MERSRSAVGQSWLGVVELAIAIGVTYFLAARFGLALRAQVGVAIFWPAAGIGVGALIALGPAARLPVAIGVALATIGSSLTIGRNAWLGIAFGFINAGQALAVSWLIERGFGRRFTLEDVPQVLGFLVACALGAATGASGAALAVSFFEPTAFPPHVWRIWFAACLLGTVTVAPLLIGIAEAVHRQPSRREFVEGGVGILALSVLSIFLISLPEEPWESALPVALAFPILLWISVRCRPLFAAAAAFVVALAIIWSAVFNTGHFGDSSIPLESRILAAQTHVLAGALLALVLAALFADRRRNEAALKDSNDRFKDNNDQLQLALDAAELGVWSIDPITGRFENDVRDRQIHGHHLEAPPKTLAEARTAIHPDDLPTLDAAFAASARIGGSYNIEYRLAPLSGDTNADQERWVALEGTVVRGADGRPRRLLGVTRDITGRKFTEQKLQKSEQESRELLGALPAAIYVTDAVGRIAYCNQNAINLWGTEPKLGNDKWCDFLRFYFADGTPMAMDECPTEIALKQGQIVRGREAIIERRDGTRIPIVPYPTPLRDGNGAIVGVVNMTVDISELKKAQQALVERNVQLALAGKAGLVGTYAHDFNADMMQVSEGYAAIHGLPEGTTESLRSEWKHRVLPEDLTRKLAVESKAFRERRGDYSVEYRIDRDGEVRWIESRSFISYNSDGSPQRIIGVNIDITERKRAEEHQRLLIAELDHRVKNVLATVSAVAAQTLETSSSMSHFVAALDGRIRSMATAHELLSTRQWQGMPLAELVSQEFAAYASSKNTKIDGPEVLLSAEAGQAMAMVIHELVTNAAKYGALSTQSGRVLVRWYRKLNGSAQLVLIWQEFGGPRVEAGKKSSYGTGVVRNLIPYEFGGTVDLSFCPEGVRCRLEIPFDRVSSDSRRRRPADFPYSSLCARENAWMQRYFSKLRQA